MPEVQNVTSVDQQHITLPIGSSEVVLPLSPMVSEESSKQGMCNEVN